MKNRVQRKPTERPTRKSPGTTEVERFNEAEADERARRRLRRRPSPTKQEPAS